MYAGVHCSLPSTSSDIVVVYRVNWLRAKARRDRWKEEKDLVKAEMGWVINYFEYRQSRWEALIPHGGYGGACYAKRQAAMWAEFALDAKARFRSVLHE